MSKCEMCTHMNESCEDMDYKIKEVDGWIVNCSGYRHKRKSDHVQTNVGITTTNATNNGEYVIVKSTNAMGETVNVPFCNPIQTNYERELLQITVKRLAEYKTIYDTYYDEDGVEYTNYENDCGKFSYFEDAVDAEIVWLNKKVEE